MTGEEWLTCGSPERMVTDLDSTSRIGERKVRLFAAACCRQVWHLLDTEHDQFAVELIERYADQRATAEELQQLNREYSRLGQEAYRRSQRLRPTSLDSDLAYRDSQRFYLISYAATSGSRELGMVVIYTTQCILRERIGYRERIEAGDNEVWFQQVDGEEAKLSVLFRDIVGNPFRPVAFDPAWRTSTVLALAEGIYADRAFDRLPILADALEDAGCDHPDILQHCRGEGPHVRGCWIVDLILGKS